MFDEDISSTGFEDASDLLERSFNIGDRTQHERGDDSIGAPGGEREFGSLLLADLKG